MLRGNNESSRVCPRAKIREEEEMLDQSLTEAGLFEEGMALNIKRELVKMITDSKQTAELEEEMRRNSDIGLSGNQEDSSDDVIAMECDDDITNVTTNQRSGSPDIFEDTQENAYSIVTSPFNSSNITVAQNVADDFEEAAEAKESIGNEIFQSDSDEDVTFFSRNENIPPPTKHDEESTHSFKSAHDVETGSPGVKIVRNTEVPTDPKAKFELKSALKFDILKCTVKDEPEPFYKTLLAQRSRSKYKQIPLFYDPALKMTKSQHSKKVEASLKRDSAIMAAMVFKQKSYDTNRWAPPVKECNDRDIDSLDKQKTSQEPAECISLPWGAKPIVLDYTYNVKNSIKASFTHKVLSNRPGLSITRSLPGTSASSSSTFAGNTATNRFSSVAQNNAPTVTIKKLSLQEVEANSASEEAEKYERPKREVSTKKLDVYDYSEDDDFEGDKDVWLNKESQRGKNNRGRGKSGRGNVANQGGGNVNPKRGGKRGKGRGSRGGGGGGDFRPPLVGLQVTTVARGNKGGTSKRLNDMEIAEQLDHPALDGEAVECPICRQNFSPADIVDHASSCAEFESDDNPQCCPVCDTIVPNSLQDKHRAKCEQKRRSSIVDNSKPGTSASFISTATPVYDIEDLISEDEDETAVTAPPPCKRSRNSTEKES